MYDSKLTLMKELHSDTENFDAIWLEAMSEFSKGADGRHPTGGEGGAAGDASVTVDPGSPEPTAATDDETMDYVPPSADADDIPVHGGINHFSVCHISARTHTQK